MADLFQSTDLVTRNSVNARITDFNTDISGLETKVNTARTGETLYNNSSGNSGTVTLSQSAANFDYLEIKIDGNRCMKFNNPNGSDIIISYNNHDGTSLTWYAKIMYVNGTTMTVSHHYSGYAKIGVPPSEIGIYNDKTTKLYTVIGYKNNI